MTDSNDRRTSRRGFLRSTATAAVGGALAGPAGLPAVLAGPVNTQTLRVGLIGCGGRGTGAAVNALKADANVHLTAMADLFEDSLQSSLALLRKESPDQVRVERERCFLGFDAYQKLIDSGVDVVLLTTPPGFRPEHLRAAVEAGKHAFVEITAAIDSPGVRSVLRLVGAGAAEAAEHRVGLLLALRPRPAPRASRSAPARSAKSGPFTPPTCAAACRTSIQGRARRG